MNHHRPRPGPRPTTALLATALAATALAVMLHRLRDALFGLRAATGDLRRATDHLTALTTNPPLHERIPSSWKAQPSRTWNDLYGGPPREETLTGPETWLAVVPPVPAPAPDSWAEPVCRWMHEARADDGGSVQLMVHVPMKPSEARNAVSEAWERLCGRGTFQDGLPRGAVVPDVEFRSFGDLGAPVSVGPTYEAFSQATLLSGGDVDWSSRDIGRCVLVADQDGRCPLIADGRDLDRDDEAGRRLHRELVRLCRWLDLEGDGVVVHTDIAPALALRLILLRWQSTFGADKPMPVVKVRRDDLDHAGLRSLDRYGLGQPERTTGN